MFNILDAYDYIIIILLNAVILPTGRFAVEKGKSK